MNDAFSICTIDILPINLFLYWGFTISFDSFRKCARKFAVFFVTFVGERDRFLTNIQFHYIITMSVSLCLRIMKYQSLILCNLSFMPCPNEMDGVEDIHHENQSKL